MKNLIKFLIEIGKLKEIKRKGWKLRGIKNPETIAAHSFRMAIMAWLLGKGKKLDINRVIKIALIHDLCEVYAGDTTPYDKLLPKNKEKIKELFNKWPRFPQWQKEKNFFEKYKKESQALRKLTQNIPPSIQKEIRLLWDDYEKGLTPEGRFVRQIDRLENLLQALEYCQRGEKFAIEPWWIQIEELIDIPVLIKFMKALEEEFSSPEDKCTKK
jgi:putative hydrolase of HD superfamily